MKTPGSEEKVAGSQKDSKPIHKGSSSPAIAGELDQAAPGDELFTIAEVAAYLKLSRRTAWRWCRSGSLPAVKIGHQWRVTRTDLENFVRRERKGVTL